MSRILFIITQSEIGGAQRYLLELAPYLVSHGHETLLAAGEGDDELFTKIRNSKHEIRNKFKLCKIPNLIRRLSPVKDFRALREILGIIKKEKPDVLFLQSTKAGFLGSLAAQLIKLQTKNYKLKTIYRIGGWSFNDPRPWWMNQIVFWMEKISALWKDVIIVNSEFDRQIAIDRKIVSPREIPRPLRQSFSEASRGTPVAKIVRIYNGIDARKSAFLGREEALKSIGEGVWSMGEEKIIIGTIANLYATKGIEYLIEAAHILTKNYNLKTITYIVIGDGKERPKLEALIKKYKLENKFFLVGRITNASQYLKAFDIFVLPSVKEGFPWVLLEAMAAEVPIVATKVGAVPEIIEDGKEGLLAYPRDSKVLAEKILQLIQNTHDRKSYAKNAMEKLNQFSLQKMLEESERLIQDL